MNNILNAKRIAKNTTFLSFRMIIVMVINLYIVRVVLIALGVEDYGIYNVVAGIITMLSVLSSVLSTAVQRFYSYALGENDYIRFRNIFSASLTIYIILAIVILVLGETIGLWFVNNKLVIPEHRMEAVNYVYQFSILSFIFTMLHIPYLSAIIAYEDVVIYAIVNICEWILKLITASLLFIIPFDRLILYGGFLFLIPIITLFTYIVICHFKYPQCRYKKDIKKELYKELLSFSGWTFFGSAASVGMYQMNTILVNIFFGPLVNASRAIAIQINTALNTFVSNIIVPIRPPMIKSYADQDYLNLNKMFYLSSKFIYYTLLMVCIPLFFELDVVLNIWLEVEDSQTVLFSQIILIYVLIMSLNNPISIIIQATGNVKEYHTTVEIFTLISVPVTYFLFKLGLPASSTFITMVVAATLSHILRLIILKKFYKPFKYSEYLKSFIIPAIFITIITVIVAFQIHIQISNIYLRIIVMTFISILIIENEYFGIVILNSLLMLILLSVGFTFLSCGSPVNCNNVASFEFISIFFKS